MPKQSNRTAVYSHLLRWEPLDVPDSSGLAWIKTLSKDHENGARTVLIKYDPGFRREARVSTWPADMLVLEGGMKSGNIQYQKGTYHYRPAETEIGPIETPGGCTLLFMTADSKTGQSSEEVFVQDVDLVPWEHSYLDTYDPSGKKSGVKVFRQDPKANLSILFSAILAPSHMMPNAAHIHDHVEEAYLLEGELEDYLDDVDGHIKWVPGFYVCRQPGVSAHGDVMITKTPCINFVKRTWLGNMHDFHQSEHNVTIDLPVARQFTE